MTLRKRAKPDPAIVAALQRELEGYRRMGWDERAKGVEAALRAIGASIPKASTTK